VWDLGKINGGDFLKMDPDDRMQSLQGVKEKNNISISDKWGGGDPGT